MVVFGDGIVVRFMVVFFIQTFSILMVYTISSTSVVCSSLLLRLYRQPKFDNEATVSELATAERNQAVKVDGHC